MPTSAYSVAPLALSLHETEQLAGLARRKSNDRVVREDLRLKLAHHNVLDSLLRDIARRSPPPSPRHRPSDRRSASASSAAASAASHQAGASIQWASQLVSKVEHIEHYEGSDEADDDDREEDLAGLSLCRMASRPVR